MMAKIVQRNSLKIINEQAVVILTAAQFKHCKHYGAADWTLATQSSNVSSAALSAEQWMLNYPFGVQYEIKGVYLTGGFSNSLISPSNKL